MIACVPNSNDWTAMLSKLGRHLTYANVTATLALVFAMSGGALAATHYLITSTKQISPKVLKALRSTNGATGPVGPGGAKGETGPAGPQGEKGTTGEKGTAGERGTAGVRGDTGSPWTAKG